MANYPIGVTKTLGNWNASGNYVERIGDNASYDAAHPDDRMPVRARRVFQEGIRRACAEHDAEQAQGRDAA